MGADRQPDLDLAGTRGDREVPHRCAVVQRGELIRGGMRSFGHERIGCEVIERSHEADLRIGERRTRGFDGGLSGTTLVRVTEDAILGRLQADDRRGGEAECEHGEDESLAAVAVHGVHSIKRAASPRTTTPGRPMNDSGAATA